MNEAPQFPLEGGCLCGQVRYRIHRTGEAFWCHCSMCRRASGAAAVPWVSVERSDFEIIRGTLRHFSSSQGVSCGFCGACGSPIVFDMASETAIDITIGTLDAPDAVSPTHHIWVASALDMSEGLGEDLPRYSAKRIA